jgi:predicted PurR-regulated permease PerM
MPPTPVDEKVLSRASLDVLIRAGLIFVLVVYCYEIFRPFLHLMLWSVILAVTLYPLQRRLANKLGHKEGRAATLIVLFSIAILLVPIWLVGVSMTQSVQSALTVVKSGGFQIPPPDESVAGWPVVGKPLYALWVQGIAGLTSVAQKFAPQIKDISLLLLGKVAGFGMGMLTFIVALIIAGFFMAFGENGHRTALRIASRISGAQRGTKIVELCTATIRAVAQGVVGVAFIQMLLIGIGFAVMGIPGAGLLALAVLLLAIMQLPASVITLPVIVFVFVTQGATLATIAFAIYIFIAGLADNVLKPLLLGRGVDTPMPVVLVGALGGMVTGGIIGLFIGPVTLAVGYQLFWQWVEDSPAVDVPVEPKQT